MGKILATLFLFSNVLCFAQGHRIELLSVSDNHTRRLGAASLASNPEISADGNFILFVSDALNLSTNPAGRRAFNLFMTDRRTHETILVSEGLNGLPANNTVEGFQFSANNRRILFESAASNLVPNDTNDTTDVFIRDLDLNQTILVSANTNNAVPRRPSGNASMSADGRFVVFSSSDKSLSTNPTNSSTDIFLRDMQTQTTTRISSLPAGYTQLGSFSSDPSISDDGRFITFASYANGYVNFLHDRLNQTTVPVASQLAGDRTEPLLSADGKFVTFLIYAFGTGVTNSLIRYSTETAETEVIVSNRTVEVSYRPTAISADGKSILFLAPRTAENSFPLGVYRDGIGMRTFPNDQGYILRENNAGDLSRDGRFVTFSPQTETTNATSGPAFRTYLYDVEKDLVSELPSVSARTPQFNPVVNADGSVVVFPASDEEAQQVYAWERASNRIDLISVSHPATFENTAFGDSKFSEANAFSDRGDKLVFASRTPAAGVTDTNNTWDIFVRDRVTGQTTPVSLTEDGQSTGNNNSFEPIISPNGRRVAFFSRATNLVSTTTTNIQLYVRDLDLGVTRLIGNQDQGAFPYARLRQHLSFSEDGNRLCFMSRARNLDPRVTLARGNVYVYDWNSNLISLVSYDYNGGGLITDAAEPVISRDGTNVAFRSTSALISGSQNGVFFRNLETGVLQRAPTPPFTSGSVFYPGTIGFNAASTHLYYGAPSNYLVACNLAETNYTILATNCFKAAVSDDLRWIALDRFENSTKFRKQVWLRDNQTGVEMMISSNAFGVASSYNAQISPDGRYVAFESRATNLVPGDMNNATDVLLYDRDAKTLTAAAMTASGATANHFSLRPIITRNGMLAFMSYASDLVPHDYNNGPDIFAITLPGPDSNNNSIDDTWELTYFNDLTHDLSADTDHDGMTDAAEFQAGTDPLQPASRLQLNSATIDATNSLQIGFQCVPGHNYRVQFRTDLENAPWQDLVDSITASAPQTSLELQLPNKPAQMYFRVVIDR